MALRCLNLPKSVMVNASRSMINIQNKPRRIIDTVAKDGTEAGCHARWLCEQSTTLQIDKHASKSPNASAFFNAPSVKRLQSLISMTNEHRCKCRYVRRVFYAKDAHNSAAVELQLFVKVAACDSTGTNFDADRRFG